MALSVKRRTTADDVRRVAIAALTSALDDGKREAKEKPVLTAKRAVTTGAVLYAAGRAAFTGRRFVREHFGVGSHDGDEPEAEEEDFDEDEEREEPEAEEDEEFEEDEEPRAEEDEDFEEDEEPRGRGGRGVRGGRGASGRGGRGPR